MDVLTREQRSKNMRNIHSKNTSIELILRKALWKKKIRYRKNYASLPGKPDIAITKYKIAIFCDSDFFHGKDWDTTLKVRLNNSINKSYWISKITDNMHRDREIDQCLQGLGWTVLHFWGSDIKKHTDECVKTIKETILQQILTSAFLEKEYNREF